ncbi:MAG TPA: DUF1697 domain-containing protein [Kofleriaceae bacterium]|nr:DUF1697 domain-containing protein [Kofleriaceae bacterium]
MPVYVALVRGINVGGARPIKMTDLRAMFEAAGARDVETYIQSGNVVFGHATRSEPTLTKAIEHAIAKAAGFAVSLVLRSAAEMAAVVKNNPFAKAGAVHVYFLPAKVPATTLADIDPKRFLPEAWKLVGRELYVMLPEGAGSSKLLGTLLRKPPLALATGRNWRTVETLTAMTTARLRS